LYNKSGAKNGRKMGHITIMEDTLIASNNKAEELFKKLN
jgi:phosphoribosylaminoimidazole carboxylase (NCAIR synthetase)